MADRKISELSDMQASEVASDDLFLIVDINEGDINKRSKRFTASGLASYIFNRLGDDGAGERFYVDENNSTQKGFFGTIGVNTISGNTTASGTRIDIASGVSVYINNFQNQNLITQSTTAPTDSGTIIWYRPPVSGLLGRAYYRYINPTGVGPSAIEWVEASPFETTKIEIGTQQVISGIFNPLRIPAATNASSGYGGIRYSDEKDKFLSASGTYEYINLVTSGYVGGIPAISGIAEGLPLVKQANTVVFAVISGTSVNADFSSQQIRAGQGSSSAPSYTFTGDLNTGIYSPFADRVAVTASGLPKLAVDINRVTVSGTFYADTISGTTFAATLGATNTPTYSFSGDLNTGIYSPSADQIAVTASGLTKFAVDVNRVTVSGTLYADTISGSTITAGLGTVAAPGFSFSGDLNTGIFSPSADCLSIVSSGLNIMEVRSSGVFISGLIYEAPTGTNYFPVVTQQDIGTEPNQVPVNGFLGSMAYQEAEFVTIGSGVFESISSSGYLSASLGTTSAPAFSFVSDNDTGVYAISANTLGLTTSGITKVALDTNRVTVSGTFYADTISGTTFAATLGSATAPTYSFSGDLNTGIYSPSSDRVAVTASGLTKLAVDVNRVTVSGTFYADTVSGSTLTAGLGTVAAPAFSFSGDLNTGIFSPSADRLAFVSSGLNIAEIRSSGVFISGLIYEAPTGTNYFPIVTQQDIGTEPNQVPLNQFLGELAFLNNYSPVYNNNSNLSFSREDTASGEAVIGTVWWEASDGTSFVPAASISAVIDGTPGTNDMPSRIVLSTTPDGGSSVTERLRLDNANNATFSSFIRTLSGTRNLPALTPTGDTDTGLYFPSLNTVGISTSGIAVFTADINRVSVSGTFYADTISGTTFATTLGTTTAPTYSFSGDLNTGIYSPAADRVAITASGLTKLAVDINRTSVSGTFYADTISGINFAGTLGTTTAPTYSFSGDLNTGVYSPAADRVAITTSGLTKFAVDINRTSVSGTFYADTISGINFAGTLGTTTAPTYSFSGDLNTGIYSPAADRVAITTSGLTRFAVDINRTSVSGTFYADTISGTTFAANLGTTTAPTYSFSGDLNTGIYSPAADQIAVTASGLTKFAIDVNRVTASGTFYADTISGATITAGLGTAATPSFSFSGDLNTGIFSPSADRLAFVSSGLNIMEVRSSGVFISGLIYEAPTGTNYFPIVTQQDIGTEPNQVPVNGFLGSMAYQEAEFVTIGSGVFEFVSTSGLLATGDSVINTVKIGLGSGNIDSNIAIGSGVLISNIDGEGNVGIGQNSLRMNTGGFGNCAIGLECLKNNTTGEENFALGSYSLTSNTTGNYNVGIGAVALNLNETGTGNTAVGTSSLFSNISGQKNTAIGFSSLERSLESFNTAFGNEAGYLLVSGEQNVFIGNQAGRNVISGHSNTIIGSITGTSSLVNTVIIAAGPNERLRIDANNNAKIGGTADRSSTAGTNQLVLFNGTAPVGTLSNGVSLYSAAGELRAMDAAGNSTLLSPHDQETNEWVYDSVDTRTGKRLRINMEKMMRFINDHFGLDFIQETFVET